MRTTIELPDDLLRRAKSTAALRGIKLKELVASCLEAGLNHPISQPSAGHKKRSIPSSITDAMTGRRIAALTNAEVEDLFLHEDLERLGLG